MKKHFKLLLTLISVVSLTAATFAGESFRRQAVRAGGYVQRSAATQRVGDSNPIDLPAQAARHFIEVPEPNSRQPRRAVDASVPQFLGTVTSSSYNSPTYNKPGVYEVPISADADFELVKGDIDARYSATLIGHMLYVPIQEDIDLLGSFYSIEAYDIDDDYAKTSKTVSNDHFKARCTAPDPTEEGVAYGCFYNGDRGYNFSKVNYATKNEQVIKAVSTQWQACGINAEGELYAVDSSKKLYKVNKTTGEQTLIATLSGVNFSGFNAGCFDLKTGVFYITTSSSYTGTKGGLYAVDVANGELTLIREFTNGEVLTSLFIPVSSIPVNAPAAPTELGVIFEGGSLSGNVSFKMPATYYDGSPASGAFHYSIIVDGEEAVTGVEVGGTLVTRPVTVKAAGKHKFEVLCFNANGNGPKAKTQMYVGTDTPLKVNDVLATLTGDKIKVSWSPADGSVNGGFVDPAATTYKVTRLPDGAVLAAATSETSIEVDAAAREGELISYTFEVVATYDGHSSETAVSNAIVLGHFIPPHTWDFTQSEVLAGTTTINANDDDKSWTLNSSSGYISIGYNRSLPMDDWFILAPVKLQKWHSYQLNYYVKASSARYSEHLEVKVGTSPTVEAMTQTITERYEIAESSFTLKSVKFTAPDDGIYYIGFHGCSSKDRNTLSLKDISLSAGAAPVAPCGVGSLNVTADPDGYNKVNISFNAPDKNVNGSELTECDITIKRGDEIVNTFAGVAAGSPQSFVDELDAGGSYTYSVIPVANGVTGEISSETVFVGLKAPSSVGNVKVNETTNDGEVNLTWDAPAKDAEGNSFNSSLVRYNVYYLDGVNEKQCVAEKIGECSFQHRVNDGTTQSLVMYMVEAVTDGGTAAPVASEAIAVGKAYTLPYADSFGSGSDYIYGTRSINGNSQWMTLSDVDVDIIRSVDDDNAYLAVQQTTRNACSEFFTGKIDLGDMTAPVLSFYTFNTIDSGELNPDQNTIEVLVRADGSWHPVKTTVISETGATNRWNKVFVPLAQYAGKKIQLSLRVTHKTYILTVLDALRIDSELDNNLAIASLDFPGEIYAGSDTPFDVVVNNSGMTSAAAFEVSFLIDGEVKESKSVNKTLDEGQKLQLTFNYRFDVADNELHTAEARVAADNDQNADDNTSGAKTLTVDASIFPAATGLTAEATSDNIRLTWEAPDMTVVRPDAKTEDFEGFEAFDRNPAGWTMVDLDNAEIGGFRSVTLPGIPYGSKQSFWVSEASQDVFGDYASTFLGHNSLKYLMQLFVKEIDKDGNPVQCDDWAISPELYGCKQTVGVWARSYDVVSTESFELLWSTGSVDPADFVSAAVFNNIPDVWRHYTVQLPEGARRLAVRCISKGAVSFMADDITFIPATGVSSLALTGYDIYCNGRQIGSSETTAFDAPLPETDGTYTYTVASCYNRGVGPMSEPATIGFSGLDAAALSDFKIMTLPGYIIVESTDSKTVSVSNVAGQVVYTTDYAPERVVISVTPGIYMVTVNGVTVKVLVR